MLNCLGAFVVAIAVALVISPLVFKVLQKLKTGQNILEYVDNHKSKQGTLTMVGCYVKKDRDICSKMF